MKKLLTYLLILCGALLFAKDGWCPAIGGGTIGSQVSFIGLSEISAQTVTGNTGYFDTITGLNVYIGQNLFPSGKPADNQIIKYDAATGILGWEADAGGAGGHVIQEEGAPLAARANLDFQGAGVVASDGGAILDSTIVTISGGASTDNLDAVTDRGNYTTNSIYVGNLGANLITGTMVTGLTISGNSILGGFATLDGLYAKRISGDTVTGLTVSGDTIYSEWFYVPSTRAIVNMHQLVDKKYVDDAVTSLGARYYALDDVDTGGTAYKLTSLSPSADATASTTAAGVADNQYLMGWISPVGATFDRLLAGVYDFNMYAARTAGTRTFRLYWTLVEYKADTSEVVIATSTTSDEITSKRSVRVYISIPTDYIPSTGSRIVGKIYADIGTTGVAPDVALYYEGDEDSHWEIPTNLEILTGAFLNIDGSNANTTVNLGLYDLQAKSITANTVSATTVMGSLVTGNMVSGNIVRTGSYVFPTYKGASGYVIKSDGSGGTSWSDGNTIWNSIGDPTNNNTINLAGYATDFTSTMDSAGVGYVFDIHDTDADIDNNNYLMRLRYTDTGDVNAMYLGCFDNTNDLKMRIGADGEIYTIGPVNFGGATQLAIPNGLAPTTNATGEIAVDTNIITQGMLQIYLASAIGYVPATTDTPGDNEVPKYDAGTGTITWEADADTGAGSVGNLQAVTDSYSNTTHILTVGGLGTTGVISGNIVTGNIISGNIIKGDYIQVERIAGTLVTGNLVSGSVVNVTDRIKFYNPSTDTDDLIYVSDGALGTTPGLQLYTAGSIILDAGSMEADWPAVIFPNEWDDQLDFGKLNYRWHDGFFGGTIYATSLASALTTGNTVSGNIVRGGWVQADRVGATLTTGTTVSGTTIYQGGSQLVSPTTVQFSILNPSNIGAPNEVIVWSNETGTFRVSSIRAWSDNKPYNIKLGRKLANGVKDGWLADFYCDTAGTGYYYETITNISCPTVSWSTVLYFDGLTLVSPNSVKVSIKGEWI